MSRNSRTPEDQVVADEADYLCNSMAEMDEVENHQDLLKSLVDNSISMWNSRTPSTTYLEEWLGMDRASKSLGRGVLPVLA